MRDEFTVMIDKRDRQLLRGAELGPAILQGKPFYRVGSNGIVEAMRAVSDDKLIITPPYAIIKGRRYVNRTNEAWTTYYNANAERIRADDKEGAYGTQDEAYVIDIVNGGLFIWDYNRITEASHSETLVRGGLQLNQKEISTFLDALRRNDFATLTELTHAKKIVYAGDYSGFLEASQKTDFTNGMNATYIVIRPIEEAKKVILGTLPITKQRKNPDLIIAAAGQTNLDKMLDQLLSSRSRSFASLHNDYPYKNVGHIITVDGNIGGIRGSSHLNMPGRFVGVAPESLAAFYGIGN